MIIKSFKELALDITEPEYRAMPQISYSTLAKYERGGGFPTLKSLFDKIETPSLLFGSCVDCIITDGEDAFNQQYMVADTTLPSPAVQSIVTDLFGMFMAEYSALEVIPEDNILNVIIAHNWNNHWREATRVKVLIEQGAEYYRFLTNSCGKKVIDSTLYNQVRTACDALKTSDVTSFYFKEDDDPNIERLYQLKFAGDYEGLGIRGMMDLVIVLHDKKQIIPCDLKTTKSVITFEHSFYEYGYFYQSQLYSELIRQAIEKDEYFKDFEILPYEFIAVDRELNLPCVFQYDGNFSKTGLTDCEGKYRPNWREVLTELYWYLEHPECVIPREMNEQRENEGIIKIKNY